MSPTTRHRWYQLGLGTMLVVLAVICPMLIAVTDRRENVVMRERIATLQHDIGSPQKELTELHRVQAAPLTFPTNGRATTQKRELLQIWDAPGPSPIHPESRYDNPPKEGLFRSNFRQ
jgi:hypothetical protein